MYCGKNVEFFNVKCSGTYGNRKGLKVSEENEFLRITRIGIDMCVDITS